MEAATEVRFSSLNAVCVALSNFEFLRRIVPFPRAGHISISKPIASGTVSNKYFKLKNGEYRDGIKSKETRQG